MKKTIREKKGVTLIALVVTIIVLLILAGITISAFTGKNGILNRAEESKNKNNVVEEKEILNTSVAISIGKSSKSKVEEVYLKNYFNQNIGEQDKDYTLEKNNKDFDVTFVATGNQYVILEDGTVLTKKEYDSKIDFDDNKDNNNNNKDDSKGDSGETITGEDVIVEVGEKEKVTVKTDSELIVKWETEDENIAIVRNDISNLKDAYVEGISNGKTTMIAKIKNGKNIKFNVTVQTSPKSISVDESIVLDISGEKSKTLSVSYYPETTNANMEITWASSDNSKATVDSEGIVTAVANTTTPVKITATTKNGVTASCNVNVITSITSIEFDKTDYLLDLLERKALKTGRLEPIIKPETRTEGVVWTSSNTDIVEVDQKGNLTAKENGKATITVKSSSGKCSASYTANVITSISVEKTANYSLPAAHSYEEVTGTREYCTTNEWCESWVEDWGQETCSDWRVEPNCWDEDVVETKWANGVTKVSFTLNEEVATSNLWLTWSGSSGVSINPNITVSGSNGISIDQISKDSKTYSAILENSSRSKASGTLTLTYVKDGISRTIYTWKIG